MARYVSFRDFDWLLLGFVLLICGIGVTEIYSATLHTKFAGAHIKQIYWILGGVVLMFAVSLINYQAMLEQVHWMYIASIASLMLVLVFGQKYLGARRWVKIGGNHLPDFSSRRLTRPSPAAPEWANSAGNNAIASARSIIYCGMLISAGSII